MEMLVKMIRPLQQFTWNAVSNLKKNSTGKICNGMANYETALDHFDQPGTGTECNVAGSSFKVNQHECSVHAKGITF